MKGVILQPNYLPWRGYYDLMRVADLFVFLDDVQYTSRDWRNRNRIKTQAGSKWITVPVLHKSRDALIKDVPVDYSRDWIQEHLESMRHAYARAPFFEESINGIAELLRTKPELLCDLDIALLLKTAELLGLKPKTIRSSALGVSGRKEDRLLAICRAAGITEYISGPSGANYIDPSSFEREKVTLSFHQYSYPEYPQLHGAFDPQLSIVDLLFNCGPESPRYIWQ